jgi:hypothetical protein
MGLLDNKLSKWLSRKLFVFGLATMLLFADKVNGDQWIAVTLVYLGSQGLADIATTWKKGKE